MAENTDKFCVVFRRILFVVLPIFYLSGVFVGSFLFLNLNLSFKTLNTWKLSGLFRSASSGFLSVFSGFLFDHIPVSLITAFWGISLLGPIAIPCTVIFEGIQQGIILAAYLSSYPIPLFFYGWATHLCVATFASVAFLCFSIHICAGSLRFPMALILQKFLSQRLQ